MFDSSTFSSTNNATEATGVAGVSTLEETQTRPERVTYYLTVFGRGRNEYLLCQDKHSSVGEAVECLHRQGHTDPRIRIEEVIENLIYDSHRVGRYGPDGQLLYVDRMALWFVNNSRSSHTEGFRPGDGLSIAEIEEQIKQAAEQSKAKWHAGRRRGAARRASRAVEKAGAR